MCIYNLFQENHGKILFKFQFILFNGKLVFLFVSVHVTFQLFFKKYEYAIVLAVDYKMVLKKLKLIFILVTVHFSYKISIFAVVLARLLYPLCCCSSYWWIVTQGIGSTNWYLKYQLVFEVPIGI
jgi:hypothetical protein